LPTNPKTQGFLLGVDVGTSKTHAAIANFSGKILGFGRAGSGNYEVVGLKGFKAAMHKAVQNACQMANLDHEQISAMGLGISGYDWPTEEPLMIEAIKSLEICCHYRFTNDAMIGLLAGSTTGWGIAVDAGTGNNVIGVDKAGRIGRIAGSSARLGEIGGGGEMVWLAQIAVTHAWTLRGPQTHLTQALIDYTNVNNAFSLIEGLATGHLKIPPSFATKIFQIAQEGDRVARDIINTSAHELALNVNAVIKQLGFQTLTFDLVLIGSIFKSGEFYLHPFRQTIHAFAPKAKLKQLTVPPVVGSLLMAGELVAIHPEKIREQLIQSIGEFLPVV